MPETRLEFEGTSSSVPRAGTSASLPARSHELLGHTADMGLRARAPDLPALFEEAAAALVQMTIDVETIDVETAAFGSHPRALASAEAPVELRSRDLAGLMFEWLNELVGLIGSRREALIRTAVTSVEHAGQPQTRQDANDARGAWWLRGRAWFAPWDEGQVRPRLEVKSATYYCLAVEQEGDGWTATAYVDI